MKGSDHDILSLIAQYEHEITEAVGMPLSMVRFAASFLASVVVGLLLNFVPTVKGKKYGIIRSCDAFSHMLSQHPPCLPYCVLQPSPIVSSGHEVESY